MTDQPEAFRWAAILEHQAHCDGPLDYKHKAARLLREQHAEIEELREEVRKWQKSFGGHLYVKTEDYAELVGKLREQHAEIERLRAERNTAQANLASMQIGWENWRVTHSTAFKDTEIERLREQLRRYRWLRDKAPPDIGDIASVRDSHDPSEIDAAIDAAMGDKT